MYPTSSLGRICLGENVYRSISEKVEGHGYWDAPEYTDTTGSKEWKVKKALSFYKMETSKVSEWYIVPCFVNGLEAYDGGFNLEFDENLISNEYTVKLCLGNEVNKGNKIVKKEFIVSLKGELYFVKFIINPKEDDVKPEVIFGRIIDPPSSLRRIFLGENVYGSSSKKVEGHGDLNAPEYTDIVGSKKNKVTKALTFYKMKTDEVSERYIAPCFMNGLEAYDGEINLALDENLISNEYVVKLCLDYGVKKGNKVVKKELIVSLKGELYFVKFIINPKEDDVKPE
nr:hypothetical protein [Tanacetum cinerariifolium]